MKEIRDKLMEEARCKGICEPGYEKMRCYSRDELIEYYIANPDWCMERNFPDLHTLIRRFSDCKEKGIYIGETFHGEVLNERQAYIFHNCKGTVKVGLNVEKGIIPMLYVANGCRIRFVGVGDIVPARKQRSIVPVYIFGDNDVSARDNKYVVFNRHKSELI